MAEETSRSPEVRATKERNRQSLIALARTNGAKSTPQTERARREAINQLFTRRDPKTGKAIGLPPAG